MSNLFPVKGQKNRWVVGWYAGPRDRRFTRVRGDKATAEQVQRHLQSQADLRKHGVVTPALDRASAQVQRPIQQHVDEFVQHIQARGRAPRYVQQLRARLERFIAFASIDRLSGVTAERLDAFVLSLRAGKYSGFSVNEFITTAKAFSRWTVMTGRMLADPLVAVRKGNGRAITKKRQRRAMTPVEFGALLEASRNRPEHELRLVRRGPNKGKLAANVRPRILEEARALGRERCLAYLTAGWTGLRRAELASLQWGDIELDRLPPRISLRAETTKSKRADSIALHPQLVQALRAVRPADAKPTDPVLRAVPSMRALIADLKFAGVARITPAGRVDLHALRVFVTTHLFANGVPERIAQSHLRHKNVQLTAFTYTDPNLLPVAGAIGALPPLPTSRPDERVAQPIAIAGA
jgi:integrase